MMSNLKSWIDSVREEKENRVGDIYAECEKKGCNRHFLSSFDTRIWLYPIEQAEGFLTLKRSSRMDQKSVSGQIQQFKIYLEVLIEKRPNHEKRREWERALAILKTEGAEK